MNILVLGKGKTGSLVTEVARERGHLVRPIASAENVDQGALTRAALTGTDVVIDFTTPHAVLANIAACLGSSTSMVIGTTGWYDKIPQVRNLLESSDTALVFGANFSVGVNLFFEVARAASPALKLGYSGRIIERHHVHKKDKPSGTAVAINNVLYTGSGKKLEIDSIREGDIVGDHEIVLRSESDMITLAHSASSRRGFAEGAVKAAEWIKGKKGFYDFRDIWREL